MIVLIYYNIFRYLRINFKLALGLYSKFITIFVEY